MKRYQLIRLNLYLPIQALTERVAGLLVIVILAYSLKPTPQPRPLPKPLLKLLHHADFIYFNRAGKRRP